MRARPRLAVAVLAAFVLNLADFDWQEAVFVDTSCTKREAAGRAPCPSPEQIHFTAGDSFGVRAGLEVFF